MAEVYLSLGSNLGNKAEILTSACANINQHIGVIKGKSNIYESSAWGYDSDNTFYNMVVHINTELSPNMLLKACQEIEKKALRKKTRNHGYEDRTLDIDILFYDQKIIDTKNLTVPHPEFSKRNFVLFPFLEINSNFTDPKSGKTIAELKQNCKDNSKLEKVISKTDNPIKAQALLAPDYIFEASWEVCNLVGGIYTVLSTRAKTLQDAHKDKVIFIGPDVWTHDSPSHYFIEDQNLLSAWKKHALKKDGLSIRIGRWDIPGSPISVLVDFKPFFEQKAQIYSDYWMWYGVDSLHAYGDYDESSMFAIASGAVIKSFYEFHKLDVNTKCIAHFNEWMTGFGLLYTKKHVPEIATVFTTHATSIGRSIAGNEKPLYDYIKGYNGDQMASELNMQAKHSIEKIAAHQSDCFTTVSEITALECTQLLEKPVDVITPNGFEDDFVPKGAEYTKKREIARTAIFKVAEALFGYKLKEDTILIGTSGRYEFKNKGIDAYIESLKKLSEKQDLEKDVLALIMVPGYTHCPRLDLLKVLMHKTEDPHGLPDNFITHTLFNPESDMVSNSIKWHQLNNLQDSKVKVLFVPSYLNGKDHIFNLPYYDMLIGLDMTVFPSYYEPWGYTPLESVAFSIPAITTYLAGFGNWAIENECKKEQGAIVIERTDHNYHDVVASIANILLDFTKKKPAEVKKMRTAAYNLSKKAHWENFIAFYEETYNFALTKKSIRLLQNKI